MVKFYLQIDFNIKKIIINKVKPEKKSTTLIQQTTLKTNKERSRKEQTAVDTIDAKIIMRTIVINV